MGAVAALREGPTSCFFEDREGVARLIVDAIVIGAVFLALAVDKTAGIEEKPKREQVNTYLDEKTIIVCARIMCANSLESAGCKAFDRRARRCNVLTGVTLKYGKCAPLAPPTVVSLCKNQLQSPATSEIIVYTCQFCVTKRSIYHKRKPDSSSESQR